MACIRLCAYRLCRRVNGADGKFNVLFSFNIPQMKLIIHMISHAQGGGGGEVWKAICAKKGNFSLDENNFL